jgi:TRAP-type C4-dicarboxylate transport system substrate-binding protein
MNAPFYDSLPPEYQKMVNEATIEVAEWINKTVAEEDQMLLDKFAASGCAVSVLTPAEISVFEKFFQPIHDKYSQEYGIGNYKLLKEIIAKVTAGETYKP